MALRLNSGNIEYFKADDTVPGTVFKGYLRDIKENANGNIVSFDAKIYNPELDLSYVLAINTPLAKGLGLAPAKPYTPQPIAGLNGDTAVGYWVEVTYLGKELLRSAQNKPKDKIKALDYYKKFDVIIHEDRKEGLPTAPTALGADEVGEESENVEGDTF